MSQFPHVFLLVLLACLGEARLKNLENDSSDNEDLFVPTREWQTVRKGQKIPKGLHVRINLETGLTEAKLLDEDEKTQTKAVVEVPNDDGANPAQNLNRQDEAHLKDALKNIKNEDGGGKRTIKKLRTYEDIKKDLDDLNLMPKLEAELLAELIQDHKKVQHSDEKLQILEDLDFLVHQYDNANEFVRLDGFREVIYDNLNSTDVDVKRESLKLFGSSVQNNVKVQIHALETGAVRILLRVLVLDSDLNVKSRAIFALSSVLRRFPYAQLQFINQAGLTVFVEQLEKANNVKIQLKIVTLIDDLMLEHRHVFEDVSHVNYTENARQYKRINLVGRLKEFDWCTSLTKVLMNVVKIDSGDLDAVEKCLNAISSVATTCGDLARNGIQEIVTQLRDHYKSLATIEPEKNEDNYYLHLIDLCDEVLMHFNKFKYKDEF